MTLYLLEGLSHTLRSRGLQQSHTNVKVYSNIMEKIIVEKGGQALFRFQERQEAYLSSGFWALRWYGLMRLGLSLQFKCRSKS